MNNKIKPEKEDLTGIYEIECNDCKAIYIGQTGKSFKERINEHSKAKKHSSMFHKFAASESTLRSSSEAWSTKCLAVVIFISIAVKLFIQISVDGSAGIQILRNHQKLFEKYVIYFCWLS